MVSGVEISVNISEFHPSDLTLNGWTNTTREHCRLPFSYRRVSGRLHDNWKLLGVRCMKRENQVLAIVKYK